MTSYDVDMASGRRTILLVEDEPAIAEPLAETLTREGFHLQVAGTAADAVDAATSLRPDLILLDLMLPDGSGFDVCREVRRSSQVPIIMLTARGDETDRIVGLEMGADDYLPKPFNPRELLARIKSVLRRARAVHDNLRPPNAASYRFAGWTLDVASRNLAAPDRVVVALSGTEYRLLRVFLDHPNRVLTRDQLIDFMLSRDAAPFDRAIDVQVSRLRHRLRDDAKEPVIIKTVRGQGYVLAAHVEAVR
jgi:two-component system OmpR family response regulator